MGNETSSKPAIDVEMNQKKIMLHRISRKGETPESTSQVAPSGRELKPKGSSPAPAKADEKQCHMVFKDEVTVHGIREVIAAPVKFHRGIWVAVMVIGLVAMAVQLKSVTETYSQDQSGTAVKGYVPQQLPSVLLCPRFRWMKSQNETGISEDVYDYINGYIPQSTAYNRITQMAKKQVDVDNPADIPGVVDSAEAIRLKFNNSLVNMTRSLALEMEHIITGIDLSPLTISQTAKYTQLLTTWGNCYMVQVTTELTEVLAEAMTVEVFLNDSYPVREKTDGPAMYYGFIGDFASLAIQPPLAARININKGEQCFVKVRMTKRIRYPGRDKSRCRHYDRSDEKHCKHEAVNEHFCDYCKMSTLPSSSYPEAVKPGNAYCNLYTKMHCFLAIVDDAQKLKMLQEMCPVPCEELIYDRTVEITKGPTSIELFLDSMAFSQTIEEFPMLTLADYLSNVGGTMGLYFGASLLSFVQIMFYCFGAPCCCKKTKVPWGCRNRAYRWT